MRNDQCLCASRDFPAISLALLGWAQIDAAQQRAQLRGADPPALLPAVGKWHRMRVI